MVEFARRAAGLGSLYPREYRNAAYAVLEIIHSDYTVESFFANYEVVIMKSGSSRWAVLLSRKDGLANNQRIMRDVDFNDTTNRTARNSSDNRCDVYPVILEGPYIIDYSDNRSINTLPEGFSLCSPWEFSWIEEEKVIRLSNLRPFVNFSLFYFSFSLFH